MTGAASRPKVTYFRRFEFHGDFHRVEPKWHLARAEPEDSWGTFEAWCGYAYSNIIGSLRVSRTAARKKTGETCGRCIAALARHERREAAATRKAEREAARERSGRPATG